MNRRRFLAASAASYLLAFAPRTARAAAETGAGVSPEAELAGPRNGPWRRLFLDASVTEESAGLSRVFHRAEKHPANPLIIADHDWEGSNAIRGPYVYGTVFREDGRLRMWYQVLNKGNHVGYAESRDGITWTKHDLGLININGSRANNLVVSAFDESSTGPGQCHNPGVIVRPAETDPARRYALYGYDGKSGHARVAFSPDGFRWRFDPATAERAMFTSSDVVNFFHDPYESRYVVTWKARNRRGRAVGVGWSADGLSWTKPFEGPVFVADDLDPDATQIYGMPVFPYQGLYVGQPWIYRARYFKSGEYTVKKLHEAQEDSPRTMEVQLAWSWDLITWTRPPERGELIPLGAPGSWDDGMLFTARAPVVMGDRLHFYYGGCDAAHDEKRVKAGIGLATLRLDGFCSLRAGTAEGWLITRREALREPAVFINARVHSGGSVTAEILDRRNRVVPGFSQADCVPFTGDATRHELRWRTDRLPENILTADAKIRFHLRNADLFSYLPAKLDAAASDLARLQTKGP
jgi:predicted GH43/DUF377 family glycosyl hydrolase